MAYSEQLNLYEDMHRRTLADDEREVGHDEIDWALDQARAARGIFNGCIHHYLTERYGDRLRHIMGFGWVVKA